MTETAALVELAIFLAAQTGALIFFAGSVSRTLRDHDRRLDSHETTIIRTAGDVAYLKAKEGIQP